MVTPVIERRMHRIVKRSGIRPERALEVGGFVNAKSLLRSPEIRSAERWCINLDDQPEDTENQIRHVVGSANDMNMFKDGYFDLVMSCAVHEHDKKFWLSMAEMKRVLRPGGLMVVCVPGFVRRPHDSRSATTTYKVHMRFDYYRFSRQAVRDVMLEGMEGVQVITMLEPPRLIGYGFKPMSKRYVALRAARRQVRRGRRVAGRVVRKTGLRGSRA